MVTKLLNATTLLLLLTLTPEIADGVELKKATLQAWEVHLAAAQTSLEASVRGQRSFLRIDETPGRAQDVQKGAILVEAPSGHGPTAVPAGLVHDWVATVFIPKTTLPKVLQVIQDYDQYKEFYKPEVADSRTLSRANDRHTFTMRWRRKVLFVSSTFDTKHESVLHRLDDHRWYSVDRTTTIQEVENAGQQTERRLPAGQGSGYIWDVFTISRYEQRDGGVYMEVETIALSRDVPPLVGWIVNPLTERLPRELLSRTLERTREAVQALPAAPELTNLSGNLE